MAKKKKVLILGGKGLIGGTIARKLKERGEEIVIVDKRKGAEREPFQFIHADILKVGVVVELVATYKPAVIINCVNIATLCSRDPKRGLPKMIAFYLELYRAMQTLPSAHYLQVGTTGAGGLGLDIPFTHGEKVEQLPVIHKAAFAGITTAMLTLLSRSFKKRIKVSEIKPGLAVFSDTINDKETPQGGLVTINGGESGDYTYDELSLLTAFMGFTTARRISDKVIEILDGEQVREQAVSHYDIIANLNSTIVAPVIGDENIKDKLLRELKARSGEKAILVTGNLGPPAISRDLILGFVALHYPKLVSKKGLGQILRHEPVLNGTLEFIKRHDRSLYHYLRRQCTFPNYVALASFAKDCHEPWQVVHARIIRISNLLHSRT